MSVAPTIVNRQMNSSSRSADRSERLPLRQVREHRKYHFLVDSSTSTSNDTNANHDDDTTATSFTTVASDNDNNDEVVFALAPPPPPPSNFPQEPEPIFAVPTLCGCGQVRISKAGEKYSLQGERYFLHHPNHPLQSSRCRGGGGGSRHSYAISGGGSSAQSSSSYSSNAHVPVASDAKSRVSTSVSVAGDRSVVVVGYNSRNSSERRLSSSTSPTNRSSRNSTDKPASSSSSSHVPANADTAPLTITTAAPTSSASASPTATTTTTTTTTTTAPTNSPTNSDPASSSSATGTKTGVSPILLLWSLLTVLVACTCTFAFLQPFWVVHVDLVHTFGMVSYCFMEVQTERSREVCSAYGGYHHLANIPSGAWQAGCVLYGAGCVMLCVSSFLALSNLGMADRHVPRVALVAGYLQAIAVLIMVAGLLIFPLGFGSNFFRHYCGGLASAYDTGHCLIGWSYMLGIMGTALSVFCPFLSQFTDMRTRDIFS